MATNQLGINMLLEAERNAQETVNAARRDKVALLKQAREEAEKEVSSFKAKRQKEFEEFERQKMEGTKGNTQQMHITTEEQIRKIQADIEANGHKVIELLLQSVKDVNTELDMKY